ncbi:MAG TPA: energy transducer TonB [Rhodocyclaceae bacterium]|nr:energy transducer TonB [Rhodocyclaceae bacterium]
MDTRLDRRLGWAVAASLAAHGLALSPAWNPPATLSGAPLQASLRQPTPIPAPVSAAPETPVRERTVAPPVRPPLPVPPERMYEKTVAPSPAASAPAVSAAPAEATAAAAAPSAPAAAVTAPETSAAQAPRPTVDANGLRQYHMALGRMAARFKRYPATAREAGWEGRVPLRLTISEVGTPAGLTVIGSSGFPILDQAALEMMRLAASHTPVPESLRGRTFSIDLAVDYSLKDDQ